MNFLIFYAAVAVLVWIGAFIYFGVDEKNISIADVVEAIGWTFVLGLVWPIFLAAVSSETRIVKRIREALDDWWTKPRWKV